MTPEVEWRVQFGEGETRIHFPDESVTTSAPVTRLGEYLYRLEAVPVLAESAGFLDTIEAAPDECGILQFRRVVEYSGWRTFDYVLGLTQINSDWAHELLQRLEELGGYWECIGGAWLFVCLPPGLNIDPTEWVNSL